MDHRRKTRPLPLGRPHLLEGSFAEVARRGLLDQMEDWLDRLERAVKGDWDAETIEARLVLSDPEYAAWKFARLLEGKEPRIMGLKIKKPPVEGVSGDVFQLPTDRSSPIADPWQYAYLITGEKKIGKTSFAIEGCEELVLQCDKPQIAYSIRETMIRSWKDSRKVIAELEKLAGKPKSFPFQRIVVDGAGEWYNMCQQYTCREFQIEHPSEEGYARAWHFLRDEFTDSVNRLLRLQRSVGCGMVFIAHSEVKIKKTRSGGEIERVVPMLPPRCEEILNGKCDAWFMMEYSGSERVIRVAGDESTAAGHRIVGRFLTAGGEPIEEVPMGRSSKEALENFISAFNNKLEHATLKQARDAGRKEEAKPAKRFKFGK